MSSTSSSDPPLPPGWSRGFSKSQQRHYYFHADTKHTQWHFPTASEAADPYKAKRRAQLNDGSTTKKRPPQQQVGLGTIVDKVSLKQQQQQQENKRARTSGSTLSTAQQDSLELADSTSVAIIVPYRDLHPAQNRAAHLQKFVPHMILFLDKLVQKKLVSDYHVYIVEQSDDGRKFNRGKLLNIGFDYARKHCKRHDVFIFHDVDLLPQDDLGKYYAEFPRKPLHIARVWDRYSNNPKYFGGVVSFSASDYKRINGYPNTFWGWGGEDDEMQKRCERLHIAWDAPPSGTLVDLEQMNLSEKLDFLRQHKEWKCQQKWEALDEHEATWKTNGLADLKYEILKETPLDPQKKSTKVTTDVKLNGNHWANDKAGVDYKGDWEKK